MKKFLFALLISLPVFAVEIKFIGPCEDKFIMKTDVTETFSNVGELTIAVLSKYRIPFIGTPEGLVSAFNTPTGDESVEILSDVELRAYGWCFSVDGVSPEVYPHEIPITASTKSITWHYGFARFYKGDWVTQCTPAYTVKPKFLCE